MGLVGLVGRVGLVGGVAIIVIVMSLYVRMGALPSGLLDGVRVESTTVVDRTGAVLYESLSQDGTRAIALSAGEVPPLVAAATLAAEDRRFWSHPGVDPIAILRALRVNLAERRVLEGGSTISQQVAKLLLDRQTPGRARGFNAKLHEALIALRLEHRFSKPEILALYLNHAAYGNQVVGVERASRAYFGVPAHMLTPAQSAFLAGLPQRPSRFNPYRSRELAVSRQRTVLTRMRSAGTLSAEQFDVALAEQLTFAPPARPFDAPHFVEMALSAFAGPRPSRIETTLDLRLQQAVAGIIASHRDQLTRHGANNVAVVVLDNASGEWLAWEGSGNYDAVDQGGRLNGPTVPRQPGSTLKPFTYAVAFEHDLTPATVLNDAPTHFPTADPAITYQPRNYDGRYRGPLLVRDALGGSLNVPAVLVASDVGVPVLLRTLSRAGLTTLEKTAAHYGLGLTLGNAEVRLDELVNAYAAFARGGLWFPSSYIRRTSATAADGAGAKTLFSPQTAFWITDILSDAGAREEVFGRGGPLEFPFSVAVKTGTSQAYHDNWTIGYSRHVTVGVWVGNFNRAPLRNSSGVTGASPIFHAVMLEAEQRVGGSIDSNYTPILERPDGLSHVEICAESGLRAGANCPMKKREWLPVRASQSCDRHRHVSPRAGIASPPSRQAGLSIVSPPDGSTYLIDPTLRREFQSLTLRAATSASGSIEWFVNGLAAGSASPGESIAWPLSPGTHRISARDSAGRSVEAVVTVR